MFRLRLLSAGLTAVLLLGATSPTAAPDTQDAAYTALAQQYYTQWLQLNPVSAAQLGLHDYDAQLGDYSGKAVQAQLAHDQAFLDRLATIDRSKLSPEVKIDATLLEYTLRDDLLQNGTLGQWKHDPDIYTQTASGAVFGTMSRDYAPLAKRLSFAVSRERAIPAMLAQAENDMGSVDSVTQRISYEDASGAISFFQHDVPETFAPVRDAALQVQFKSANAGVVKAMSQYARWIKTLKPSGTYAIGSDAYRKRLLYEDGLDMPVDQYLTIGERALAQTRAQFIAVAKRIDPKKTPLDVYLSITKTHPQPDELLPTAQSDLVKLRGFIAAKHIVTLPPDANIKVIETPPFQRATTEAAEDSAGPLETVATQAYYYVTPVDPTWNAQQKEEYLAEFNDFEFPIISAHEVYPGHFTNFAIDRHLDLSLTRKLSQSSEFAEGWAHYSEQMMVDQGWGNGDPRVRLAQLDEALLRNCRYVVGVKLHTQGMTIPAAEKLFTHECFQTKQIAVGETLRGTQDPMYGYYTLGKLMILKLRADYKKKLGSAYTLEKFHDALLAHGDPPLPLLRPILLGADDDGHPL